MESILVPDTYIRNRQIHPSKGGYQSKTRFVIGLPQTQEQRNATRAAVQANAAFVRWRKDTSQSQPEQPPTRRSRKPRCPPPAAPTSHFLDLADQSDLRYSVFDPRNGETYALENLFVTGFEGTLHAPVLPPFFPLGYPEFQTKDEIWQMLQRSE